MMRGPISVTLVSVTTTDEGKGKTSETTTERRYSGIRFAPTRARESTVGDEPQQIHGGTMYRRGSFPANADDRIVVTGQHALIDGTWEVDGDPVYWGSGVEVAVKRASS